jgi:hypothetical protein
MIGAQSSVEAYAAVRDGPAFLDLELRRNGQLVRIVVLLHEP